MAVYLLVRQGRNAGNLLTAVQEQLERDQPKLWKDDVAGMFIAASYQRLQQVKPARDLAVVYGNSRYVCFVYDEQGLIGAGRALADGLDCSYLCDIAVHPRAQGSGLGKAIVQRLVALSAGHRKILLYANPGKEGFYLKLGFLRMRTAMAIFANRKRALATGLVTQD